MPKQANFCQHEIMAEVCLPRPAQDDGISDSFKSRVPSDETSSTAREQEIK